TYTTLDDPLATVGTVASAINASGQIVGYYFNNTGQQEHGFLRSSNGAYTALDDPLATNGTQAFGINDLGQIVGQYYNATGTHSFLYSGVFFPTIDDPANGQTTLAYGISNTGQIVGPLKNGPGTHGSLEPPLPNPPPPASTSADMILRGSNSSP